MKISTEEPSSNNEPAIPNTGSSIGNAMMPNFLIIGAAKAGTTSLYYYLSQHPQIYMSPSKEPRFFALEGETLAFRNPDKGINETSITQLENYLKLFEGVKDEVAIGEASPLYLYSEKAVERIKYYIPHVKLIAILRNPVDRAFSCYTHLIREGIEPFSFEGGLKEEESRIRDNWAHLWHYRQAGYYYPQLKRYFKNFGREQIKIYLYEDLNKNSTEIAQDAYRFLGVDDSFAPDLTRMNVSGVPKIRLLQTLLGTQNPVRSALKRILPKSLRKNVAKEMRQWNLENKLQLDSAVRMQLIEDYRKDILKLEGLIERDLHNWLEHVS